MSFAAELDQPENETFLNTFRAVISYLGSYPAYLVITHTPQTGKLHLVADTAWDVGLEKLASAFRPHFQFEEEANLTDLETFHRAVTVLSASDAFLVAVSWPERDSFMVEGFVEEHEELGQIMELVREGLHQNMLAKGYTPRTEGTKTHYDPPRQ